MPRAGEIEEAHWFDRAAVRAMIAAEAEHRRRRDRWLHRSRQATPTARPFEVILPGPVSIARRMIEGWAARSELRERWGRPRAASLRGAAAHLCENAPVRKDVLAGLDDGQRAAVLAPSGPVCVLAGAGTGKTRTITHRIAHLVGSGAHPSSEVLAVTFTTRAAGEMRLRLRSLGVPGVQARTFHSAALKQLRYFWPRSVGGPLWPVLEHKLRLVAIAARRVNAGTDAATLRDLAGEIEWSQGNSRRAEGLPGGGRQAPTGHPAAGGDGREGVRGATRPSSRRPSSSTSTTCCCTPAPCWRTTRRSPASSVPGTGVSSSTSTRTSPRCSSGRWTPGSVAGTS